MPGTTQRGGFSGVVREHDGRAHSPTKTCCKYTYKGVRRCIDSGVLADEILLDGADVASAVGVVAVVPPVTIYRFVPGYASSSTTDIEEQKLPTLLRPDREARS